MSQMNHHEIIDRCQDVIMKFLKDQSPECTVAFVKDRIDETNLPKVSRLAKSLLPPKEEIMVMKALDLLKKAVNEICVEYHDEAIRIGKWFGKQYGVPTIDSNSLALEGLYKAALRFVPEEDFSKGSFRSYIITWIRQCVQRSVDPKLLYTLDASMIEEESTTRIEQLSQEDTKKTFIGYGYIPPKLEKLRQKYCPHLSIPELKEVMKEQRALVE